MRPSAQMPVDQGMSGRHHAGSCGMGIDWIGVFALEIVKDIKTEKHEGAGAR